MNRARVACIVIAGLLFSVVSPTNAAELLQQAGRVIEVAPPHSAEIVGLDHSTREAIYMGALYPGERIKFTSAGALTANIYGKEITFRSDDPNVAIPPHDTGPFSVFDSKYFDRFSRFLGAPRMALPVATLPRRDPDRPPPVVFTLDPALSQQEQYFPRGAAELVILWRGPASSLVLTGEDGEDRRIDAATVGWSIVPLSPSARRSDVSLDGAPFHWTLRAAEAPPSPPWFATSVDQLSEAQRVVRALWILKDGPPSWRFFAATELHDVANDGNFVAIQFWQGLRSGELDRLISATSESGD